MLVQAEQEGVKKLPDPVDRFPDTPALDDVIAALLTMVGLRAKWDMNYWKVYLPEASQVVANVGGKNRRRWSTGVAANANYEAWMMEINRFWKDTHPGEPLPFGGILPTK